MEIIMAKKSETEHKVDLGEVLENIDLRNLSFYDSLDEEQKKALSPFVAMKFASSIDEKSKLDIKHHYISMANTVNMNLWNISAHKKLQWLLLSIIGINKKMFHPQIPFINSKVSKTKIDVLIEKKYTDANKFELKSVTSQNFSNQEFPNFVECIRKIHLCTIFL